MTETPAVEPDRHGWHIGGRIAVVVAAVLITVAVTGNGAAMLAVAVVGGYIAGSTRARAWLWEGPLRSLRRKPDPAAAPDAEPAASEGFQVEANPPSDAPSPSVPAQHVVVVQSPPAKRRGCLGVFFLLVVAALAMIVVAAVLGVLATRDEAASPARRSAAASTTQPAPATTAAASGEAESAEPEASPPTTEDSVPAVTTEAPTPAATTENSAPAVTKPPTRMFFNGTWLVGSDIEPGRYRLYADDSCYWARLAGFSGDLDDILANENIWNGGYFIVDVLANDAGFELSCWNDGARILDGYSDIGEPLTPESPIIPSGVYAVGDDIAPGLYQLNGACYWARLAGFSGDLDDILANENNWNDGQFVVEIQPGDTGFQITC